MGIDLDVIAAVAAVDDDLTAEGCRRSRSPLWHSAGGNSSRLEASRSRVPTSRPDRTI
jgi:hypothetical protein